MLIRNLFFLLAAGCATIRQPAGQESGRLEIPATATNAGTIVATGPHVATWNPLFSNGKLLITIAGTNSKPSDFGHFTAVAAAMGYAVIGVDYPNHVITTTCKERKDTRCFDGFREELNEGHQVSDVVHIDAENSIQFRIAALLKYLAARDARWQAFVNGDRILWENVVVAGHSQGAGHAAYTAKLHAVDRVILLAGPQDHLDGKPAAWTKTKGKTPGDRFRALLHKDDSFGSDGQLKVFQALCRCKDLKNVIVSAKPDSNPHMAVIFPQFREEWARMLER